ncbi:MAG: hypothetical protein DME24_08165 [Verrucomicrobia bacterium]|nr:MAG: hypothetical protein DME24_08165 [Verrucomicrobiota bacterium]
MLNRYQEKGKHAQFPGIFTPFMVWNCFTETHVGCYGSGVQSAKISFGEFSPHSSVVGRTNRRGMVGVKMRSRV